MQKSRVAVALAAAVLMSCAASGAWSAAYRCEIGGKTTYSDKPCNVGRQSEVAIDSEGPSAADRAAAAARLRSDKAAADAMQRDRESRERVDRLPIRGGLDRGREVNACAKLAVRAKRAHEDYNVATPRDQAKKRVRMLRADEDYAALCKKR